MNKNIYFIYSGDDVLIARRVNDIVNKLEIDNNNIVRYNLEVDSFDKVIEEALMPSLFGDNKVIIIDVTNGINNIDVKDFTDYLEHYNKNSYLIFVANVDKLDTRLKITKILMSKTEVMELKKDKNYLEKYVNNYLEKDGYKITDLDYFLGKVGTNIDNITNELDKLKIYKLEDKIINKDDIDSLISDVIEDEIFALTNKVVNNDREGSLKLYHNFIDKGYEPVYIIAMLGNQFRFLYQVKRLLSNNKSNEEIAKILEANIYRVKFATRDCYYYHEDDLLSYLKKLAILDKNIKLGKIDKNIGLELFIINKNSTTF